MSNLGPLTLVFSNNQRFTVSSLKEVSIALKRWPGDDPDVETLRQLTEEAMAGRLAPRVAFDAFALKAYRSGLVEPLVRSAAWKDFAAAIRPRNSR